MYSGKNYRCQLETEDDKLIGKAQAAIKKYHVNVVVANELQSRYDVVKLVKAADRDAGTFSPNIQTIRRGARDIEYDLVLALVHEYENSLSARFQT